MTDTKWSEWIEWNATDDSVCPLEYGVFSEVQLLSGCRISNHKCPEEWDWNDTGGLSTICAYRYELTEDPDARMDNIARNGNDGEHYPPAEQSMPADLEHLARTVLEWSESLDRVCRHKIGVEWFSSERFPGRHGYSQSEWLQARRDLGLVTTEGEDEAFDAIASKTKVFADPSGYRWRLDSDGMYHGMCVKVDLNRPLGDDITAYDPPGPTTMPECTFTTPDEDEAWREVEKKINPVWQSPHDFGGVCVFHGCRYSAYEQCYMCVLAGEAAKEEAKQPAYNPEDVAGVHSEAKQARYQDTAGEDWIDEAARTFTPEEFRGAMRFSIGKYNRRMGKKDDLIKEIEKMRDYCQRWIDVEQGR